MYRLGEGSYRFELGDFKCISVSDGSADFPLKNFFANVPEEKIQELLRERNLPTDHITTPFTYLYVETGEHKVLVDMGAGHLTPKTGKLIPNMKIANIDPASIDSVFITHAHPDHIGGTLDEEDKPVFTNANYYIWKREWDFWFSESEYRKANEQIKMFMKIARENLQPIQDRIRLVEFSDHEFEALPGVQTIAAPGHTPGHMVVSFSSGGEKLMYIGDTVLYPLHLEHPDWIPVYDILPDEAADSKRRIFDMAADEKAWVIGQHFPPFPSLGHVVRKGRGWVWRPVE
jgi:glyoxylase-like metal-dependent hydrolase (beta-lactamase superfamily II)